jgi:hypothetical protein
LNEKEFTMKGENRIEKSIHDETKNENQSKCIHEERKKMDEKVFTVK